MPRISSLNWFPFSPRALGHSLFKKSPLACLRSCACSPALAASWNWLIGFDDWQLSFIYHYYCCVLIITNIIDYGLYFNNYQCCKCIFSLYIFVFYSTIILRWKSIASWDHLLSCSKELVTSVLSILAPPPPHPLYNPKSNLYYSVGSLWAEFVKGLLEQKTNLFFFFAILQNILIVWIWWFLRIPLTLVIHSMCFFFFIYIIIF